jgi:hypothetical protein
MKFASTGLLVFVAAILPTDLSHAAGKQQTLEEVIVSGSHLKPYELRQRIVEAEDRFYSRYNEINDEDEFDVNCIVVASTGTNLKHRICRPVFEERVIQEHGREMFLIRQDVQEQIRLGAVTRAPGTPSFMPMDRIVIKRPAFRKHMRHVVEQDKGLRDLLKLRATLEQLLGEVTSSGRLDASDIPSRPDAAEEDSKR